MSDIIESYLKTADISKQTDLAESTVRKYAAALESAGYHFYKDGDIRLFQREDIEAFLKIKELTKKAGIGVSHAATVFMAQSGHGTRSVAHVNADDKDITPAVSDNSMLLEIATTQRLILEYLRESTEVKAEIREMKALLERMEEQKNAKKSSWWKFWS